MALYMTFFKSSSFYILSNCVIERYGEAFPKDYWILKHYIEIPRIIAAITTLLLIRKVLANCNESFLETKKTEQFKQSDKFYWLSSTAPDPAAQWRRSVGQKGSTMGCQTLSLFNKITAINSIPIPWFRRPIDRLISFDPRALFVLINPKANVSGSVTRGYL